MKCSTCLVGKLATANSRETEGGYVTVRTRVCTACGARFQTRERVSTGKAAGAREKLLNNVERLPRTVVVALNYILEGWKDG